MRAVSVWETKSVDIVGAQHEYHVLSMYTGLGVTVI